MRPLANIMNLNSLSQDDLLPRFYRMVAANTLSNIMVPLAGLIGSAFLGHLTEIRHLAGVALATILLSYIYRVLNFIRMGTTGITAQAVGQGDRQAMLMVGLRNGLVALVLGVALVVVQYPLQALWFGLLDAAPEVKASGQAYFITQMWGAPAFTVNLVLIGWLLGQEMSGRVLLMAAIANAADVALDYLYIVQWGWGSTGAGLSACVSQYVMLVIGIIFVVREVKLKELQALAQDFWNLPAFKKMFVLNGDIFLRILLNRATVIIFTNLSAAIGTAVLAGNALMMEVVLITIACIEGVGFATEALAGNFKGKGETKRLAPLLKITLGTSLLIAIFFALSSLLFPQTIFGLLTNHAEVSDEINIYLPWLLPVAGFYSIAFTIDGYLMGLGNARISRESSFISFVAVFTPLAAWGWYVHNNHILWLSVSAFMLVRALMTGGYVGKTLTSSLEG